MIYLDKFELVDEEAQKSQIQKIKNSHSKDERFPIGFFYKKQLKQVDFENITIFYGGNGSGKSTLLNIIAEKLNLNRHADTALTTAFYDYCDLCKIKSKALPPSSTMLTSEDVFKAIFHQRAKNIGINEKKAELEDYFDTTSNDFMFEGFENSHLVSKKLTKLSYIEKKTEMKERQYSNGENAIRFFKNEMNKRALYLLDEPENSLSPKFQLELKTFLEQCATDGSQLIIATHSPFILAIKDAKIYSLDDTPVSVKKWFSLKNMQVYYDFFIKHKELFEADDDFGSKKVRVKKTTTDAT